MDSKLAIDTAVLLLYFIVIISIGLYMGRKEESLKDFALGGRRIPWWAVLASLIAAETSAGTFFGTPGEGFSHRDYTYLQLAFGTILGRILVSYIFIKPYYDYKVYSIYEYLTARFGVPTKNAASAIFMVTRVLASGARLYVAAIALALAYEMIRGVQPGQRETLSHLHRLNDCHCNFDRHLHDVWWYQGCHLDRFDSSLDHDWERVDCACIALLRHPRRLARDRATPRRISNFGSLSPPVSTRRNMAGTKSKECSRQSTRSLPG